MISESRTPRLRRVLIMPLLILAIAAVIWQMTNRQKGQQAVEVRQLIEALCQDVAAGVDVRDRLGIANPDVAQKIAEELKASCEQKRPDTAFVVDVSTGDHPRYGNGSATHTAVIIVDGRARLGLRVVHTGAGRPIQVVGFWRP